MNTKSIQQTVIFDATPVQIFQALMDEKKHTEFTSALAIIDQNLTGKFSTYDGYCHGYHIEVIEHEKIVQAWHFAEDGWPDDHFSICTFILEGSGTKTTLTFTQTDIPEHKAIALAGGWNEFYWEPLRAFLNKK